MAELLKTGLDFLYDKLKSHDSRTVSIVRGAQTTTGVSAVVRSTVFDLDKGGGVVVTIKSRDFIIQKTDYVIAGAAATPGRGDQIVDGSTYEVMTKEGKPHVSEDPYGKAYRFHTMEVVSA